MHTVPSAAVDQRASVLPQSLHEQPALCYHAEQLKKLFFQPQQEEGRSRELYKS